MYMVCLLQICNYGIFGTVVVQLLCKYNIVRRTFLLISTLDRHTLGTMRESFIAVHAIRAHLLPPPSAIQREERAREEGIDVDS